MASKKRGLSVEEKKQRLYQLFLEKKEVFQLKELEKIAPKEKGIVSQSVKDVLQMLVDDGFVDSDKIGTLMCFWAFQSKATATRKRKLAETEDALDNFRSKKEQLDSQLAIANAGKDQSDERESLLSSLNELESKRAELQIEMDKYKDFDAELLERRRDEARVAKMSANRWTDNIFSIKNWCSTKFQIEESVMNKQFGIPTELDYID